MTNLLTVKELNQLTCSQIQLNLLRSLVTSDLSFCYMLLKPDTLIDIIDMCESLYNLEQEEDITQLSPEEKIEYLSHINDLREYANRHKG